MQCHRHLHWQLRRLIGLSSSHGLHHGARLRVKRLAHVTTGSHQETRGASTNGKKHETLDNVNHRKSQFSGQAVYRPDGKDTGANVEIGAFDSVVGQARTQAKHDKQSLRPHAYRIYPLDITDKPTYRNVNALDSWRRSFRLLKQFRVEHSSSTQRIQRDVLEDESDFLEAALEDILYSSPQAPTSVQRADLQAPNTASSIRLLCGRPSTWTPSSFSEYAKNLAASPESVARMHSYANLHGYFSKAGHHQIINAAAFELVSVLVDANTFPFLTDEAVERSLAGLLRQHRYTDVLTVHRKLQDRYKFSAGSFDYILAAAARSGSETDFWYILRNMIRNDVLPTTTTWRSLHHLVCMKVPAAAPEVVQTMRKRGLLSDPDFLARILEVDVTAALRVYLNGGGRSVGQFLRTYESKFGDRQQWLTVSAASKMVEILLLDERVESALRVVNDVKRVDSQLEWNARRRIVDQFVSSGVEGQDFRRVIKYLRIMTKLFASPATQKTTLELSTGSLYPGPFLLTSKALDRLFFLAWKQRRFNVVRVVWRYACATRNVSWDMSQCMNRDVEHYTSQEMIDTGKLLQIRRSSVEHQPAACNFWIAWAPRFALGVHEGLPKQQATADWLPYASPSKAVLAVRASGSPGERQDDGVSPLPSDPPAAIMDQVHKSIGDDCGTKAPVRRVESLDRMRRDFQRILKEDMNQAGVIAPSLPFVDMLELAWQRDQEWRDNMLGLPNNATEEDVFKKMLRQGVGVHMEPRLQSKFSGART